MRLPLIPGQKPPTGLSAAQRRATGCRRVDEPTSIRKFRAEPRASYAPLDRLPARFREGRSGWPKTRNFGPLWVCLARTGSESAQACA
jgi:hypothetical protein